MVLKYLAQLRQFALFCKLPQFYTNLKNLHFAMNEKNGIGGSKPRQSRRQGESAPELPVGRAYAVESLAVGEVLNIATDKTNGMF